MSKILAFDTSCEACSVALLLGDEVFEDHQKVPRQHTKLLLPMIDGLLKKAGITVNDLDAIAFGAGPGSFTGLRITAGVAQGLGLGADIPLLPISTLATLAEQAYQQWGAEQVFTGLDARMGELYWATYHRKEGVWSALTAEQVAAPQTIHLPDSSALTGDWVGIGPAWRYQSDLPKAVTSMVINIDAEAEPQGKAMLVLAAQALAEGKGINADQVSPTYLRDNVAWQKSNHRNV